ncbi:MAG: 50S ribosomal protein L13 [Spirochaetota bacterium]|jgi:large subunit ribosomal protein L13
MKTSFTNKDSAKPRWFLVDADGVILGHLATAVANIVRGKNKPDFTPHADAGDFVVVINASKVRLTGKKETLKNYSTYSAFVGGQKNETVDKVRARHPELIVERAVKGMVPHTRLGRVQLRKVKVYGGAEHPHQAQQLESLKIA